MAAIRQNAGWLSVVAVCGVVLASWRFGVLPAVSAQQTYTPLDDATQSSVDDLRRTAGLDNDALAALNLTEDQLEGMLAAVRTWHESTVATLRERRSALADARAAVRIEQSAVDNGQQRAEHLFRAKSQRTTAQASYDQLLTDLHAQAVSGLTPGEVALLFRLQANRVVQMPFRVLELSEEESGALQQALFKYGQRMATIRDEEERAAARIAFQSELASAIGAQNVATINGLGSYVPAASLRVTTALTEVLPTRPAE